MSGSAERSPRGRGWRGLRLPQPAWAWLAAAALLAGFAGVSWPVQRQLVDHVVVLDITQSMNVRDQTPDGLPGAAPVSRLERAKAALHHALDELPCGSRLGWAVFTEYRSFLLFAPVEVCANRAELRATLAMIRPEMAWSGNSEVAKGLHAAFGIARQLPERPSVVFVTDGHEAPPLNARHRPRFDDKPGEVPGLLVGVGALRPSPIPKTDPYGRPIGLWQSDDVLQVDPRSLGRGASVGSEKLVDEEGAELAPALGATPGSEHLSALREAYLRLLADESGLGYLRLADDAALIEALQSAGFVRPVAARAEAATVLGLLALLALLWPYRPSLQRWRAWRAARAGRPPA